MISRPRDLQKLFSDTASNSPDLGPPPQSQFEQTVASSRAEVEPDQICTSDEEFAGFLSANLDTRRRRRETRVRPDEQLSSSDELGSAGEEGAPLARPPQIAGNPIRAGAKRKLEHRDQKEPSLLSSSTGEANGSPDKQWVLPVRSPARKPLGQSRYTLACGILHF